MNEIILGIFTTDAYINLKQKFAWFGYPFRLWDNFSEQALNAIEVPEKYSHWVFEYVYKACIIYPIINFMLDKIYLPLTDLSITCMELQMIIESPDILEKTTFWLNEEKIPTDKVIKLIQSVKDNQITFDNIDFNTL